MPMWQEPDNSKNQVKTIKYCFDPAESEPQQRCFATKDLCDNWIGADVAGTR